MALSVRPDNLPKDQTDDLMLLRWIATVDCPELGLKAGDALVYNPTARRYTVTREVSIDPGSVLNRSVAGDLAEQEPLILHRSERGRLSPPLSLLRSESSTAESGGS